MTSPYAEYREMLRALDLQLEAEARARAEARERRLEAEAAERRAKRQAEKAQRARQAEEDARSGAWSFIAPPAGAVPPPGTVDRTERPPWGGISHAPGLTPADRASLRQAGIVPPAQSTNIRGA